MGVPFVVVPMIGNNILRATGDTKTPGLIMIFGALANFLLDPVLIFGPGPFPALGVRGAAMATLIGRGCTFLISMYALVRRERLLSAEIPRYREVWRSWVEILFVGLPNAGTRMIIPFGQGVITRAVASYGAAAVAGYGIATRVEFFSLVALNALSSVIGPFVGQNIGAGKFERVRECFVVSRRFSFYTGMAVFFLNLFFAGRVAALFNEDPEVVTVAGLYLRIVSLSFAAQGFYLVVSAGCNVLKRPFHAVGLSFLELFGLAIPLALLGSRLIGITGIFGAIGISYLITGGVAWMVIDRVLTRYKRSPPQPS